MKLKVYKFQATSYIVAKNYEEACNEFANESVYFAENAEGVELTGEEAKEYQYLIDNHQLRHKTT